jgi:hypothetical protein
MAKISQESLDFVKSIALVDVAHALGLPLNRSGKQVFLPCPNPEHVEDKYEHCAIETRKNIFNCFTCNNVGGNNAISFYKWHMFGTREGHFQESVLGIGKLLGIEIKDTNGKVMVSGSTNYTPSVKYSNESLPPKEAAITHAVYSAILSLCSLHDHHRKELMEKRKYTADEIKLRKFASVPTLEEWIKIYALLKSKNYPLDRIPGLSQIFMPSAFSSKFPKELGEVGQFEDEKGAIHEGHWFYNLSAPRGYFIPVYDENGYIIRLRVRKDDGSPKYVWFSSEHNVDVEKSLKYARRNGASSGGPFTIAVPPQTLATWKAGTPLENVISTRTLMVTEGEHKSNIAAKVFGIPVIGLAGIGNFETLIPFLQKWKINKLILAYDMDTLQAKDISEKAQKNQQNLYQIVLNFAKIVKDLNITSCIWSWNIVDGKGIDDLVINRKLPIEFNLSTGQQKPVTIQNLHDF